MTQSSGSVLGKEQQQVTPPFHSVERDMAIQSVRDPISHDYQFETDVCIYRDKNLIL